MTASSFGLLGSGEFEPWAREVDTWLIGRPGARTGPALILPTAAAPEGDGVFDRWGELGVAHYRSLGIDGEVLPLKTRRDADREDLAEKLEAASVAFFSGGNPAYLVQVLAGSLFWSKLAGELGRGLVYGGCSAGVASLGEAAPDSAEVVVAGLRLWKRGLRLFPGTYLAPHWDGIDRYAPGLKERWVASIAGGRRLVGIDERTALVGDGTQWSVMGSAAVHVMQGGAWSHHPTGTSFTLDLVSRRPPRPAAVRPRSGAPRTERPRGRPGGLRRPRREG